MPSFSLLRRTPRTPWFTNSSDVDVDVDGPVPADDAQPQHHAPRQLAGGGAGDNDDQSSPDTKPKPLQPGPRRERRFSKSRRDVFQGLLNRTRGRAASVAGRGSGCGNGDGAGDGDGDDGHDGSPASLRTPRRASARADGSMASSSVSSPFLKLRTFFFRLYFQALCPLPPPF